MYVLLPAATLFYRVIGPGRPWPDILAGKGAYFGRQHGAVAYLTNQWHRLEISYN
ncbi:MAG TPA: hypothetical protein VKA46_21540 [Gemmataceae bacterium]|nr:hypothetical protein [Gemmataceae bacterium]